MPRSVLWTVADQLTGECRASPDGGQPHLRSRTCDALPNLAVFDQARRLRRRWPGVSARALPLSGPRGARRATCARVARINAAESAERLCWVVARVDAVLAQDGSQLVKLGVHPGQLPGQRQLASSGPLQSRLPR